MRIYYYLLLSFALAALSACPSVRDPSPEVNPSTSPPAVAPLGKVVDEIGLRIWDIHQARNGDY